MLRLLIVSLLLLLATAGQAADQTARRYEGILRLKGNAPFVKPVLEDKTGKQWALSGVDKATAQRLQNRLVIIKAIPVPEKAALRPGLKVIFIHLAPPAP